MTRGQPVHLGLDDEIQKVFQDFISNRILRHMHKALNIDENKN